MSLAKHPNKYEQHLDRFNRFGTAHGHVTIDENTQTHRPRNLRYL